MLASQLCIDLLFISISKLRANPKPTNGHPSITSTPAKQRGAAGPHVTPMHLFVLLGGFEGHELLGQGASEKNPRTLTWMGIWVGSIKKKAKAK
jgi:hypothetical protein